MRELLIPLTLPALAPASTPGPASRFDPWTIIGPGGGGTMIPPTISPHDPRIVVEHCDMTGAYITLDGAQSWRMFSLRSVVNTFAYDLRNARAICAANEALWRSEDTGRSWRMIFPDPRKKTVEHQNGDRSEYSLTTGDTSFPARKMWKRRDPRCPAKKSRRSVAGYNQLLFLRPPGGRVNGRSEVVRRQYGWWFDPARTGVVPRSWGQARPKYGLLIPEGLARIHGSRPACGRETGQRGHQQQKHRQSAQHEGITRTLG